MLGSTPGHPHAPTPRPAAPVPLDAVSVDELADAATAALTAKVVLTPKPGLPDCRSVSARQSSFHSFVDSGERLHDAFREAAAAASDTRRLAAACRAAQAELPHTGAWAGLDAAARLLCLLAAACGYGAADAADACRIALDLGRATDERNPHDGSGPAWPAKTDEEALALVQSALPMLREARGRGEPEEAAQLDVLLHLIASLDDSRVLHEHGPLALRLIQQDAAATLDAGGAGSAEGAHRLRELDVLARRYGICPAGSGALLAGLLLLDGLSDTARSTAPTAPTG
ncbi:hypothetical protein GTY65_03240 [Streptomyces sp. SID8379]|uniref:triphosphoribosyl-dephospho-CoA synthase n=1 Tax=unclassified Streptomyces TaxID=2593676 RepID=UPI000372E920|nr:MULTISPECIES: triphosphoribosyl-dephospho-CoA synthase [unclassified Streptomyces]MYW63098.1 hypothetical protein [Streptomyces sp. SID8379]